ncbi:primosomal replication protein N [Trinickia fusca]|uniref:Replication restart protein PriB n=1 Tax=Trinickia fusca TaxID=2419777 RepID=A0A494XWC0_9BURK|nr:primosomal replication protein N [Trinickia fusca]RKP52379.1 primosomal replication protein N [Trinickia fusca]
MNRLQLTASIVEREPLRYTPAGVPIASCTLHHQAQVVEAGIVRQVELTLPALAAGAASGKLEGCEMGVETLFTGFLAKKSRNARTLVFHITELQDIGKD